MRFLQFHKFYTGLLHNSLLQSDKYYQRKMKRQINQYYACNKKGYVKYQNVQINEPRAHKQIFATSRCNQILPHQLLKIQVSQRMTSIQKEPQLTKNQQLGKKEDKICRKTIQHPLIIGSTTIMQKDEVHSVQFDDKVSPRTIKEIKTIDLTQSSITNPKRDKHDMKRSLFSTNQSSYTNDTSQNDNQRLQIIITELMKEKQKRRKIDQKYETLLDIVNKRSRVKTSTSDIEQDKLSQDNQKSQHTLLKGRKQKQHKSHTQNSSQSEEEQPIIIHYGRSQRKRATQPLMIKIASPKITTSKKTNKWQKDYILQHEQNQNDFMTRQVQQRLQQMTEQITLLHQNVDYLQDKLNQQEMRHQKQLLTNKLRQKQRRIEEIMRQNLKFKEMNQSFMKQKANSKEGQNCELFDFKQKKSAMFLSLFVSFSVMLLALNLKAVMC